MLRQTTRKNKLLLNRLAQLARLALFHLGTRRALAKVPLTKGQRPASDCGPSHLPSSQWYRDRRPAQPIAFQVVSPLSVAPPPDGCTKSKRIFGNAPSVSICDGTRSDLWISVSYSHGLLILSLSLVRRPCESLVLHKSAARCHMNGMK